MPIRQAMLASQNPYYMFEQTRSRSSSVASIKSTRADSSLDLISEDSEADIHSISSSHISGTKGFHLKMNPYYFLERSQILFIFTLPMIKVF